MWHINFCFNIYFFALSLQHCGASELLLCVVNLAFYIIWISLFQFERVRCVSQWLKQLWGLNITHIHCINSLIFIRCSKCGECPCLKFRTTEGEGVSAEVWSTSTQNVAPRQNKSYSILWKNTVFSATIHIILLMQSVYYNSDLSTGSYWRDSCLRTGCYDVWHRMTLELHVFPFSGEVCKSCVTHYRKIMEVRVCVCIYLQSKISLYIDKWLLAGIQYLYCFIL